jgi:stearoyl-CoA desaturase (Delta-9 desaturase)
MATDRLARWHDRVVFPAFHLLTVALVLLAGVSWGAVALCLAAYALVAFGITAGYHRYFAHRTFSTGRAFQLVLALLGTLALQKGVLWWASHHRQHHRASDREEDVHSPVRRGFWWAHLGWIVAPDYKRTDWRGIKDFTRYPELRWLNRWWGVPFLASSALVLVTLGFQYMVWGCFVRTVLLWHATFAINSLAHLVGRRVYATTDESRNNALLALITHGEGWHNNHHYYPASARQGFRWYELDASYLALCALERLGVVWNVRRPPPEVVAGRLGGRERLLARLPIAAAHGGEPPAARPYSGS